MVNIATAKLSHHYVIDMELIPQSTHNSHTFLHDSGSVYVAAPADDYVAGGDPRPPLDLDLLHPYDAARMKMTPANPAVGNWRNNGSEMLEPPMDN
jgi:hypothetical protein